ncbi:MAG: NAD(P)H-dependent oxidoreductase [Trueperaceae bacterium]|nr:NAD(P)H-dependent oxidoreductase [Trueperaceae bacterium]
MNISLLLAHPNPESFNHALAEAAAAALRGAGHEVAFHDLQAEGFDPVMTAREVREHRSDDPLVERHCDELRHAGGLVVVHPVWFDQPPAILKGWIDRVVRQETAFRRTPDGRVEGLLGVGRALLIHTANMRPRDEASDPLVTFWRTVLDPCGVTDVRRTLLAPVVTSTHEQRAAWLREVAEQVAAAFPAADPGAAPRED